MFKYFPTNYVWNLSVDLAIEMGARIGEIEEMCAPLQEAAKQPDAAGTPAFHAVVGAHGATSSCELAAEDEARGRLLSAGEKLSRAAHLLPDGRAAAGARRRGTCGALSQRLLDAFARGLTLSRRELPNASRSPMATHIWRRWLVRAEGVGGAGAVARADQRSR